MFLTVEHACVSYPGSGAAKAAVQDVSLVLRRGEIGVLIGPSGCGKTSLLRAVAGLERLAAGRIVIDGRFDDWSAYPNKPLIAIHQAPRPSELPTTASRQAVCGSTPCLLFGQSHVCALWGGRCLSPGGPPRRGLQTRLQHNPLA